MKPQISICIPTYNRAPLLRYTLQSVVNQTVKPAEVLIIDNASTDNTEEVVSQFKPYGFTYLKNKVNIGMAGNHNLCIELARHEYFTFLPSDDLIAPHWYEEWVETIAEHEADLYISPLTIVNHRLEVLASHAIFSKSRLLKQPHVMNELFSRGVTGLPPSGFCVYRKSVFDRIGRYDPADGGECDVKIGMKLFDQCDVYYLHKFLFAFRHHDVRSFDKKVVDRTTNFLHRYEHYLKLLQEIIAHGFMNTDNVDMFIRATLGMNLANINLYLARWEFRNVLESYRLSRRYFPKYLTHFADWKSLFRYQMQFFHRALTFSRILPVQNKELGWIADIRSTIIS